MKEISTNDELTNKIYTVREIPVMLDSEIAAIYGNINITPLKKILLNLSQTLVTINDIIKNQKKELLRDKCLLVQFQ